MKRDIELIRSRRIFIKKYFKLKKSENPKISLKEIANELSDWFLFISPNTIINDYRHK